MAKDHAEIYALISEMQIIPYGCRLTYIDYMNERISPSDLLALTTSMWFLQRKYKDMHMYVHKSCKVSQYTTLEN